ncbi:MAG: prepilin-type N-terminal cleavage/methylation domain-containing protein [bacterium]
MSITKKNTSGFTLLEVMVSMVIIGMGLVAVIGLFSSGLKSASLSQAYTQATILARHKMEEILSQKEIQPETMNGDFEDTDSEYRWEVEISPYEFRDEAEKEKGEEEPRFDSRIIKMYQIHTKVSWKSGKKDRSVDLVTLKTVLEKELK